MIWALEINKEFIMQRGRKIIFQARKYHEKWHGGMKVLVMFGKQQVDQIVYCDESRVCIVK